MDYDQREIVIHTPNKIYKGTMDVRSKAMRTIDIFNSANIFWKNPAEKCFDDAIMLNNVALVLEGGTTLREFSNLQISLSDILFLYDSLEQIGDENEKMRATAMKSKTKEGLSNVQIMTHARGDCFYFLQGVFHGLFKNKSKQRFIPITKAKIYSIFRVGEKWQKKSVAIHSSFIALSTADIEACTFTR